MEEIIKKAREYANQESKKSIRPLFELANEAGQTLAKKLNANQDIVILGTLFMDLKRKQAMEENKIEDHVQMSLDATKEFLSQFDLDEEIKDKIYNCVEAHHKDVPFTCIEAEICANADCYKFLHPKGMFLFLSILTKRELDNESANQQLEFKMDEKWNILSLDICKQELEEHYHSMKKLIATAKQ